MTFGTIMGGSRILDSGWKEIWSARGDFYLFISSPRIDSHESSNRTQIDKLKEM